MNLFQGANSAATFLILSAIVAGFAKFIDAKDEDPISFLLEHREVVYLGLFLLIFRIKSFLDDHKHFSEDSQDKSLLRYVGFILAVISWTFWGIAGYELTATVRSSEMMVVSILISTCWIVVHVMEILIDKERRNKEVLTSLMREKWVIINVVYVLFLGVHIGWLKPAIPAGLSWPLVGLLIVLAFDVVTSRSFTGILQPST